MFHSKAISIGILLFIPFFAFTQNVLIDKIEFESKVNSKCKFSKSHYKPGSEPRFLYCIDEKGEHDILFDFKEKKYLENENQADILFYKTNDDGF